MIHFAGISGSLRKDSYNTKVLNNITDLLPEGVEMEIISFKDLPVYNGDDDMPVAKERPASVKEFRDKLTNVDAIVIVSPEYNYSIPGGLKNAFDWASRGDDSPLLHKPVALLGASNGMWGTIRMQFSFHNFFQALNMKPVYKPEVMITLAASKFYEDGKLNDEKAKELIVRKMQALKELVIQSKK